MASETEEPTLNDQERHWQVNLLANGFELVSVEEFEEGKLPRRLFRVVMRRS